MPAAQPFSGYRSPAGLRPLLLPLELLSPRSVVTTSWSTSGLVPGHVANLVMGLLTSRFCSFTLSPSPVVGCGRNSRTGPLDFHLVRLPQDTRVSC